MDGTRTPSDKDDCVEIDEKDSIWTDKNELVFIELMNEEVKKGNLTTSTFSKSGWRNIIQGLKERVGKEYNHSQLKNKYHGLRARHRKFTALIKETGIGYNSLTGEVNATEEVWETLKKVHTLATRFRKKGCKEFKELCLIFGDTTATGNNIHASTKLPSDSEDESHKTNNHIVDVEGSEDDDTDNETRRKKKKIKSEKCSPKKKRVKKTFSHALENVLVGIVEQSKRKNDLLEQKMEESTMPGGTSRLNQVVNEMKDCLKALELLDIDDVGYGKAVKALHDSSLYRVMASLKDFESDSDDEMLTNVVILLSLAEYERLYLNKQPCRTSILSGHDWVLELLNGNPTRIFESLRMNKERFQHSTATISKYVRKVLYALNRLSGRIIVPPSFDEVPPHIEYDPKYYPYLQNCVGAIDGTHVYAHVPGDEQTAYRGKNIDPTQNVMCACDFDMRFTFVMAGWEGTANDSRIFLETVSNSEHKFPMPPKGKYYLVDSGYTNMPGFLSPYRGNRYHLKDFRGKGKPRGRQELFNYKHSSLRNVIERCFGVLKNRFPILDHMHPYSLKKQKYFVIACCVLHNFIRINSRDDEIFHDFEKEEEMDFGSQEYQDSGPTVNPTEFNLTTRELWRWSRKRDRMAKRMWDDYLIENNLAQ